MPVPDFQQFFRPILILMSDGVPRTADDVEQVLVTQFKIAPEDQDELLPKVNRTRLRSNVLWALTYLKQAGLLLAPKRGVTQITSRGTDYAKRAPNPLKIPALTEFPEFVEFQRRSKPTKKPSEPKQKLLLDDIVNAETPEERISSAHLEHNAALAQEVLSSVKSMSPAFFEQLIVDLMLRLGYGGAGAESGQTLGKSGDGGVDGVISQDKLGLEKIYLQAKRWTDVKVGSKDVQAFVGALTGQGALKGVFITTSAFTKEATQYVKNIPNIKLSLIDGLQLADLMIEYDLGVAVVARYDVKRVDSDFFGD